MNLQTKAIQPADVVLDGRGIRDIAELAYDPARASFRLAAPRGPKSALSKLDPGLLHEEREDPLPDDTGRFLRLVDEYIKSLNAKPPPGAPAPNTPRPEE